MPEYRCANRHCPTRTGEAPEITTETVIEDKPQEFFCPVCRHQVVKRFTAEESGERTRKILRGMHRVPSRLVAMHIHESFIDAVGRVG